MSYLNRLNSLLTSTTSRYDSLRRNILSSSSEDDTTITTPDSTHVSRVLRAYYTEKARPFPSWLGPDPRTTQPQPQPRPVGSLRSRSEMAMGGGGRGRGLGEIWGDGSGATATIAGGGQVDGRREGGGEGGVRPLPSQRVGSLQQGVQRGQVGGGGSSGGAAERLKARLNRGGSSYATQGLSGWEGSGEQGRR